MEVETIVAIIVVFFAFFLRGLLGFGGAMIATPILSNFYDLKFFVPVERLFQLALGFILLKSVYELADKKKIVLLFLGFLPGTYSGVWLLANYPNEKLRFVLAILIVLFSGYMYWTAQRPVVLKLANYWGPISGFFAGVFGGLFGIGGPMVLLFLAPQIETKERLRATMISLFTLTSAYSAVLYYFNGLYSAESLKLLAVLTPPFLIGSLLGFRCISFFSEKSFRILVAVVLFFAGSSLFFK